MAVVMNIDVANMVALFTNKNNITQAEAEKLAWLNYALKSAMETSIVHFTFLKKDGSIRDAHGTLDKKYITYIPNGNGKPTPNTLQRYWDTDKQEYRCFTKANLLSFQMVA